MRIIITFIFCSLLFSCTSNKPTRQSDTFLLNYIDLTSDSVEDKDNIYWKVIKRIDPRYPSNVARDNISGCVKVIVGIDSSGQMAEYKIENYII